MAFMMLIINELHFKVVSFGCEAVVFCFEKYWMLSVKHAEFQNLNMSQKLKFNSKLILHLFFGKLGHNSD